MSTQPVRLFEHTNIDRNAIERLFAKLDSTAKVSDTQLIAEGGSTTNYAVRLSCGKQFLLKLYPENGGNGAREMAAYRYASAFVRVPQVYVFDDSREVIGSPYAILEFIEGVGLKQYITDRSCFPEELAGSIGRSLARLHGRAYGCMAALDGSLCVAQKLLPITSLHEYYLNGPQGKLLDRQVCGDVLGFLAEHRDMLARLEQHTVFCHGDFSLGNMIIDRLGEVWFIDFEYSLAAPPYSDIGRFFRDQPALQSVLNEGVLAAFIEGYNACAGRKLDADWYKLARLMDMTALLHLLSFESAAAAWAKDIEEEIGHTMRVLRGVESF
jgi:aminoglycoside phosphotransferase (APT) family kinase protein